jgi:hypothetical protein
MTMTVPERVVRHLDLHTDQTYCDDCLLKRCEIKRHQQVQALLQH